MSSIPAPLEWTVLSMLEWATTYFTEKSVSVPRLSAEWILAHSLGLKRLDLYLQFDRPLHRYELDVIRPLIKRRAKNEPLQYIVGETDFYNSVIKVDKRVLIPRPETEELVDYVLNHHKKEQPLSVLDIGTGSGCIAISLKKECPEWKVTGVDISPAALDLARENALLNEVEVTFELGNLFAQNILDGQQFDLIVSNPPYIAPDEAREMDTQVTDYEPKLALFAENPVEVYRNIERIARKQLSNLSEASVYLELNENLAEEIAQSFAPDKWQTTLIKDLSGKDRILRSYLRRTSNS